MGNHEPDQVNTRFVRHRARHGWAAHLSSERERPAALSGGQTAPPTVSVIVPCYNYGHFLEGCVASALAQRRVDVRLLVIDDCSPDGSAEVARRIAERDDRVEFRRHEENAGMIATINEGLAWASGEYVVVLSADDLLAPGALSRATAVMTSHPSVGMVYGRPLIARHGRRIPRPSGRWRGTDVWSGPAWLRLRCKTGHNCISSPEVVVRTSVHRAVGGYNPACYHTSDLNLWLRIAAVADIAYIRGVPQAIYRIHAGSMLRSQAGPLVDLNERRMAFESFFAACAPVLVASDALRDMACRALARQALWQASRAVDRGGASGLIDELIEFALDVYSDSRRLREWHGLQLRQRIGAGRSLIFFPFIATGAAHRLDHHVGQMRWRLRGI